MRDKIHPIIGFAMLVLAINFIGCANGNFQSIKEVNSLKLKLSQIKGKYVWRQDLGKYHYSEQLRLAEILSKQNPEKLPAILADCLDDNSKTQSTINNKHVPLGIICYEALTQQVYYEPPASDGDIAHDWAGYITPESTPDQIQAAKQAWKKVIETKSYILQ